MEYSNWIQATPVLRIPLENVHFIHATAHDYWSMHSGVNKMHILERNSKILVNLGSSCFTPFLAQKSAESSIMQIS